MSGMRYTEEFKRAAVAQITDQGHSVKSVAERLGVCIKSIYDWVKRYGSQEPERRIVDDGRAENRRLKAELARVTEERDTPYHRMDRGLQPKQTTFLVGKQNTR